MGVGAVCGAGGAGDVDALFHGAGVAGGTRLSDLLYAAAWAARDSVLGLSAGGGAVFLAADAAVHVAVGGDSGPRRPLPAARRV